MPGRNGSYSVQPHYDLAVHLQELDDPGDAGVIGAVGDAVIRLVSAHAGPGETRTLGDPLYEGQRLHIYFETDSGAITITADSAVNQAGNTTLLAEDAGDHLYLMGGRDGAGDREWRVVKNDGWTLS